MKMALLLLPVTVPNMLLLYDVILILFAIPTSVHRAELSAKKAGDIVFYSSIKSCMVQASSAGLGFIDGMNQISEGGN